MSKIFFCVYQFHFVIFMYWFLWSYSYNLMFSVLHILGFSWLYNV